MKKAPEKPEIAVTPAPVEATEDSPEKLIALGKKREAAQLYLKMAAKATPQKRPTLQLKAAQLLIGMESTDAATDILKAIDNEDLNKQQDIQFVYLKLQLALQARQAEQSLQLLTQLKSKDYAEIVSEAELISLSIRTYELRNDNKQASIYRILLEPYLVDEQKITANQLNIIRSLVNLEHEELQLLAAENNNESVKSWIDLATLIKKSKNPFRLADMITSWKSLHPQHPLRDNVIGLLAPKSDIQPAIIDNIALLLPLSGPFAKAGNAVRDGFLTSYYSADISANKPTVRLYDTASGKDIIEIYQTAINEGANIIVGPLRKEMVSRLAEHGQHEIPLLALNQLEDNNFYHRNFFQFSLSPEAEAKQIAQKAWVDGHNLAAVIFPENKWGKRLAAAFKAEWEALGGKVTTEASYDAKRNDFSKPIKSLLAIDQSEQRRRDLSRLIQAKMRFEPRRRQDIDVIFMAALPRQARLIPPQLKFHHAESIPIYTTSHSFSGRFSSKNDRDLNGVIIADMPWTLNKVHMQTIKQQVYRAWPNESRQFNRLYALGTDAYNILHYLTWLRSNSKAHLQGATGELYMNEQNQVMRILSWAKFRRGTPDLLTTSTLPIDSLN